MRLFAVTLSLCLFTGVLACAQKSQVPAKKAEPEETSDDDLSVEKEENTDTYTDTTPVVSDTSMTTTTPYSQGIQTSTPIGGNGGLTNMLPTLLPVMTGLLSGQQMDPTNVMMSLMSAFSGTPVPTGVNTSGLAGSGSVLAGGSSQPSTIPASNGSMQGLGTGASAGAANLGRKDLPLTSTSGQTVQLSTLVTPGRNTLIKISGASCSACVSMSNRLKAGGSPNCSYITLVSSTQLAAWIRAGGDPSTSYGVSGTTRQIATQLGTTLMRTPTMFTIDASGNVGPTSNSIPQACR